MCRWFLRIGVSAAVVFVTAVLAHAAQKPVIEERIVVDHEPAPASTAAMKVAAAAVVAAKHTGLTRVIDQPGRGRGRIQSTAYTFEIFDVLKADPALSDVGGTIEVALPGADRELPTHKVRVKRVDVDEILPDEVYIIFLAKNRASNGFELLWGPEGLYRVTIDKVRGLGRRSPRHDGRDVIAFREALRAGR